MFQQILTKIKEYDRIIIHRHIRPDGDCMGSQMGLKHIIKGNFPEKEVYCPGENPPAYLSDLGNPDNISDELYKGALVIVVDTSNEDRISDERWKLGDYIIKIDHHDDSPAFGDIQYVDPTSPANSSIIVSMFKSWEGLIMPKEAAYALYFGIVTDTGRFRFRGVNGTVLNNAGLLIDQDIDIQTLYDKLYVSDVATLKLNGYVLNNFKVTENGVAYIHFTKKIMKKYNVSKEDASNLVSSLGSIRGCMIWVAFIDQLKDKEKNPKNKKELAHKEIRARVRSRNVAINEIASHFRGGGHLQAAGATVYSKAEMKALLKELDAKLAEYKKGHPDAF